MFLFVDFIEKLLHEPKSRIQLKAKRRKNLSLAFSCAGSTTRLCAGCAALKSRISRLSETRQDFGSCAGLKFRLLV
jgi:hypothetical protein